MLSTGRMVAQPSNSINGTLTLLIGGAFLFLAAVGFVGYTSLARQEEFRARCSSIGAAPGKGGLSDACVLPDGSVRVPPAKP